MSSPSNPDAILSATSTALSHGCWETAIPAYKLGPEPGEIPLQAIFTSPASTTISARGFLTRDGDAKLRAYPDKIGTWKWEARSTAGQTIATGKFLVNPSRLPGKLALSLLDPRQFQYRNGSPYLHFGDNAQRLLHPAEKHWKAYIDQASQAGFTKLRAALFDTVAASPIEHCEAVEERLLYALARYPKLQFQLSLFGGDLAAYRNYADGDPSHHLAARYAQARFSALPNIHWSAGDFPAAGAESESIAPLAARAGEDLKKGEAWGSLVTALVGANPALAETDWLDYLGIAQADSTTGATIQKTRPLFSRPIALEKDRIEQEDGPLVPRYYFRRLFWSVLLSGGHPSYGGLRTAEPNDGFARGIFGYYDACNAGRLRQGAHDFLAIEKFFRESGIALAQWVPDDAISGGDPALAKSMRSANRHECLAYIANPDTQAPRSGKEPAPQTDKLACSSDTYAAFTLELPFATGVGKWFNPASGEWRGEVEITHKSTTLLTPGPGDWAIWVRRS